MSVITVTKENYQAEVVESNQPVLLDFWATWCGPCSMVSPIIDELAEAIEGVKFGKVNVDEQRELASAFKVMSIPTLLVIQNGKIVERSVGAKPKHEIAALLSGVLA